MAIEWAHVAAGPMASKSNFLAGRVNSVINQKTTRQPPGSDHIVHGGKQTVGRLKSDEKTSTHADGLQCARMQVTHSAINILPGGKWVDNTFSRWMEVRAKNIELPANTGAIGALGAKYEHLMKT